MKNLCYDRKEELHVTSRIPSCSTMVVQNLRLYVRLNKENIFSQRRSWSSSDIGRSSSCIQIPLNLNVVQKINIIF